MRFDANKFRLLSVVAVTAAAASALLGVDLATGSTEPPKGAATPTTTQVTQGPVAQQPSKVDVAVDMRLLQAERKKAARKSSRSLSCRDPLAQTLYKAGFRGHNIREAWAIAMRESNGRPNTISNGVDHGLFQFNRPAWGNEPWWDTSALLTADYNAKVAYRLSDGGNNWGPWGMRDHAEWNFASYGSWSDWQIQNWIINPYMKYYNQYPC